MINYSAWDSDSEGSKAEEMRPKGLQEGLSLHWKGLSGHQAKLYPAKEGSGPGPS